MTQPHTHPKDMTDVEYHHHLVNDHGYHPDEIAGSGRATGHNTVRGAMTDLHNWSHQATNYGLEQSHAGDSPWPGEDLPHHHPDWQPGRTYSFHEGVNGARQVDTGNTTHVTRGM